MTVMPSTHAESKTRASASISSGMPTPDASPKQGFSSIVDSLDFGDEQKTLLDELDKLREYGVDKYIELPQLIVVGDQSSGKSSVLEAITELPFPRSSIRCTRFATQIKLRHTPEVSLRVGIIPDPKRTSQERQRLASFPSTFPPDTSFSDIMALAEKYIVPDNNSSFCSKDVFSIEFTGPNKPHLTVVDLPGLIAAANNHQTQSDVDAIRDLAYSYMRNPRTIILAIVSAASDLELQPVLAREARQFDPLGARTMGIITKPDKTETPEREAQFLELARNENIKFKLGWHVLRNRAPTEMNSTPEERKRTEKAFFAPPSNWSKLGADSTGIEPLRLKLSKELVKHVMHEMPMVQQEIRNKLDETRRALEKLGDRKDTPEEMRDELRELCEKSQALTRTALDGQVCLLPWIQPIVN
jgi:GTPase SAR1 family protein